MKHCYYEPSIRDYIYIPPGYGCCNRNKLVIIDTGFCSYCCLKPCIVNEHFEDLSREGATYEITEGLPNDGVRRKLYLFVHGLFEKYFGKRHTKAMVVPQCVDNYINESYPDVSVSIDSDDSDNEDCVCECEVLDESDEFEFDN